MTVSFADSGYNIFVNVSLIINTPSQTFVRQNAEVDWDGHWWKVWRWSEAGGSA